MKILPQLFVLLAFLNLKDAATSVSVKAQKEAKLGDVITATCKTEKSNPAAEITWIVDGIPILGENTIEAKENGGWITTSKINVNVTEQDRNVKLFTCYAVNQELDETVPESFSVNILYAPDPPNIFGYSEGTAIHAGKLQRLTCISHGGHPLPELKWYKGEDEVSGSQQTTSGNIVSKEISIIAEASDNGATYRCKSTSKAVPEPLVAEINLTVYYRPVIKSAENITVFSDRNVSAIMYCTAEGIPDVTFTWTFKGEVVHDRNQRIRNETVKLNHVTYQGILIINYVRAKDFGAYICVARNELGLETIQVALLPNGAPDPPHIVRVLNTSRDALLMKWVPGFKGGYNQTHRIRFQSVLDSAFSHIDMHPTATNSVWISGLKSRLPGYRGRPADKRSKSLVDIADFIVKNVFFLILAFISLLVAIYCRMKIRKRRRKYSEIRRVVFVQ